MQRQGALLQLLFSMQDGIWKKEEVQGLGRGFDTQVYTDCWQVRWRGVEVAYDKEGTEHSMNIL